MIKRGTEDSFQGKRLAKLLEKRTIYVVCIPSKNIQLAVDTPRTKDPELLHRGVPEGHREVAQQPEPKQGP